MHFLYKCYLRYVCRFVFNRMKLNNTSYRDNEATSGSAINIPLQKIDVFKLKLADFLRIVKKNNRQNKKPSPIVTKSQTLAGNY